MGDIGSLVRMATPTFVHGAQLVIGRRYPAQPLWRTEQRFGSPKTPVLGRPGTGIPCPCAPEPHSQPS